MGEGGFKLLLNYRGIFIPGVPGVVLHKVDMVAKLQL